MKRFFFTAFCGIFSVSLFAFSPPLAAAKINGKLSLAPAFLEKYEATHNEADKAFRGYWNDPNAIQPIAPLSLALHSDFGVVLLRDGAPEPKPDPIRTVQVFAGALEQNVIVIRPQSRIKFHSVDPLDHDLYASDKHDFKPQQMAQNSVRPVDFYSAGLFEVRCTLMPHFSAWIVVEPATYVAELKRDGAFQIDAAEPGEYTVKVFFRGQWIHERKLTIRDEKEVQVTIQLESPTASAAKPAKDEPKEK
ncbi:MAG: hypothetical protein GX146_06150 [Myxococcales bacterium]|jgi:hypothetical protein|nr:hypothetical protein [Myxococcales bacterium]